MDKFLYQALDLQYRYSSRTNNSSWNTHWLLEIYSDTMVLRREHRFARHEGIRKMAWLTDSSDYPHLG